MHIHSYQIQNVLNVFRKQLRQGAESRSRSHAPVPLSADKGIQAAKAQRQSIIDKVSVEIVQRIVQFGPQKLIDRAFARYLPQPLECRAAERPVEDTKFTYTMIDEHSQRITHTLTIRDFSPLVGDSDRSRQDSGVETQLLGIPPRGRAGDTFEE